MANKTNEGIRTEAAKRGVCNWEIADKLGISEAQFYRKLRYEMPAEEQKQVLHAIALIADERCA